MTKREKPVSELSQLELFTSEALPQSEPQKPSPVSPARPAKLGPEPLPRHLEPVASTLNAPLGNVVMVFSWLGGDCVEKGGYSFPPF